MRRSLRLYLVESALYQMPNPRTIGETLDFFSRGLKDLALTVRPRDWL
jgi:hypothetical protein